MDEAERKAYADRFRARIEEWEAKLDQLGARARRAEADLRIKLNDEESDLRKRLDEARARLRELQAASGEGWEEVKGGAERIWRDVRAAWDRSAASSDDGPEGGSGPGEPPPSAPTPH